MSDFLITTVMTALISGLLTGFISIVGITIASSKSLAVTQEQISELRKDVEKHNNMIERVYKLEQETAVIEQRTTASEARIKKLEENI